MYVNLLWMGKCQALRGVKILCKTIKSRRTLLCWLVDPSTMNKIKITLTQIRLTLTQMATTLNVMAHLHCQTQSRLPTRIFTQNLMATLYDIGTISVARTWTQILIWIRMPDRFCTHSWNGWYSDQYLSPRPVMSGSLQF